MASQKKTWVNSMFSQLSHLENNNSQKTTKRSTASTGTQPKRTTRKKSSTEKNCDIIDLQSDDEHDNDKNTLTPSQLKTTTETTNESWIDIFAPSNSEELAIHPKKLLELQQWFKHCAFMKRKKPAQLCLLTGPSGSGKTAAIRTLAKENNIHIQEWINPVDQEMIYNLGDQLYGDTYVSSQVDAFKNFLFKASRYKSLLEPAGDKRLLLIEDFPNFLLRDSSSFQEILEDYLNYGKSPLIFIVTDAKRRGLNISYNLFTDQIKQKFLMNHISFNAVASTIMQKAMKRFCNLMRLPPHCEIYKQPSADIIESIIVSAQGDIRNALINLHFSSLKGAPNVLTKLIESKEEEPTTSRKRKRQTALKSVGRDECVTMMHALGRVFNPKYTDDKKFTHSPEELAEAFTTEPKTLIDLIQANYLQHFREIDYVLEASNGLSLCDQMLNEYRDDSLTLLGLNVGIRSVMVANIKPLTGWMPIKGQKRLNSKAPIIPIEASKVLPNISSNLYALDYKTFVKIIATPKI